MDTLQRKGRKWQEPAKIISTQILLSQHSPGCRGTMNPFDSKSHDLIHDIPKHKIHLQLSACPTHSHQHRSLVLTDMLFQGKAL